MSHADTGIRLAGATSSIAAIAGVGSFAGWALGIWLGIRFGNVLWVVSSFVMCLWTFWVGVALMRRAEAG